VSVMTVVFCQVLSLRRGDHSPRGALPTAVRRCVIYKSREYGGHGPLGAVAPNKKMN
jgi:hypothetical protein